MKTLDRAIVVGASSGIGAAIALELGRQGAHVTALARRQAELEDVAAQVTAAGGRGDAIPHDVRDFEAVPGLFRDAVERMGGLDLMVYAAGVMPGVEEHEYDFSKDRLMVEVNLLGAMAWLNPATAWFESQRAGTVVGISSVAGERGRRKNPAYGTSKAALSTYLEALRNRVSRYGVDVVTIKPGFVETRMTEGMGELLWMVEPDVIARETLRHAHRKGGGAFFVPKRWGPTLAVIRSIPSPLFRRLNV